MDTTKFFGGAGTLASPYLIHNVEAWSEFINNGYYIASYFLLISSIDASSVAAVYKGHNIDSSSLSSWRAYLDGNGFKVYGVDPSKMTFWSYAAPVWMYRMFGYIKNIHIVFSFNSQAIQSLTPRGSQGGQCTWENVILEFTGAAKAIRWSYEYASTSSGDVFRNVLFIYSEALSAIQFYPSISSDNSSYTNCYVYSSSSYTGVWPTGWTKFSSLSDAVKRENYSSSIDTSLWVFDGASLPRFNHRDVSALTRAYVVKGKTMVGGIAKSRTVSLHSPVDYMQFSASMSNALDGSYMLKCGLYSDHVAVIHRDNYGSKFTQSKSYAIGDVIHPSTPNGYRYICTTAGTSAATDPTAWPTTGTLTTGSAIFTPSPVYKPETMLVVPVLIDLLTGLPV